MGTKTFFAIIASTTLGLLLAAGIMVGLGMIEVRRVSPVKKKCNCNSENK